MPELPEDVSGEVHSPRDGRRASPKFAVQKISQAAEGVGERDDGGEEVREFQERDFFGAAEKIKGQDDSDEAAKIGHSIYTDILPMIENIKRQKNLRKVILEISPVIDEHIADPRAKQKADDQPREKFLDSFKRDVQFFAPNAIAD